MPDDALEQLTARLHRIHDLEAAARLLEWDQETYMPEAAVEARARQLATLHTLAHEHLTDEAVGRLLETLAPQTGAADPLAPQAGLVRVTRRDYDRARKVPAGLVAALAETTARARSAWKQARAEDDFARFAPHLERIVTLSREKAEALGYDETPYDALLDQYEPGMTTAEVSRVFAALREGLVPLAEHIAAAETPDDSFLHRRFDADAQWAFGLEVARAFGYDLGRGRQDRSAHPFTTSFSPRDVRITTRIDPRFFNPAFFATLHEAGHALYEQGLAPELERTPLADGASLGMHESQSRLWENLVGRSRPFWQHYFPKAKRRFPEALGGVSPEAFYRAVNKVEPSLIRVEADEVTYNLHIMLRFELERGLIEGTLSVDALPARWNDRMESYLGLRPDTDADGVLQDVHWSLGAIGYFPTYALGNLMSVQLFEQARADLPELEAQIGRAAFGPLLGWLRTHVHRHGRLLQAQEILERTTGRPLRADDWLGYVRRKFGGLYSLPTSAS